MRCNLFTAKFVLPFSVVAYVWAITRSKRQLLYCTAWKSNITGFYLPQIQQKSCGLTIFDGAFVYLFFAMSLALFENAFYHFFDVYIRLSSEKTLTPYLKKPPRGLWEGNLSIRLLHPWCIYTETPKKNGGQLAKRPKRLRALLMFSLQASWNISMGPSGFGEDLDSKIVGEGQINTQVSQADETVANLPTSSNRGKPNKGCGSGVASPKT